MYVHAYMQKGEECVFVCVSVGSWPTFILKSRGAGAGERARGCVCVCVCPAKERVGGGGGGGGGRRGVLDVGCSSSYYTTTVSGAVGCGDGGGGGRGRVLMSYVCDAETPKLAHAIVAVLPVYRGARVSFIMCSCVITKFNFGPPGR